MAGPLSMMGAMVRFVGRYSRPLDQSTVHLFREIGWVNLGGQAAFDNREAGPAQQNASPPTIRFGTPASMQIVAESRDISSGIRSPCHTY